MGLVMGFLRRFPFRFSRGKGILRPIPMSMSSLVTPSWYRVGVYVVVGEACQRSKRESGMGKMVLVSVPCTLPLIPFSHAD